MDPVASGRYWRCPECRRLAPARSSACQCGASRPASPSDEGTGSSWASAREPRSRSWPWGVALGLAVFGAFMLYRAGRQSALDNVRFAERWRMRRSATPEPMRTPPPPPLPLPMLPAEPVSLPSPAIAVDRLPEAVALAFGLECYSIQEVGPELARAALAGDLVEALIVTHVEPYGPADHAGLRERDVLLKIDGRTASSRDVLAQVAASHRAQDAVVVDFMRERRIQQASVILAPAMDVFGRACDAGDASACLSAGNRARDGISGVSPDPAAAVTFFERACSAGRQAGCINLGRMLRDGRGAPADPVRAAGLFERACDAGVGAGCHNLGILYAQGLGVPRDAQRGRELVRRACQAGDPDACGPDDEPADDPHAEAEP